MSGCGEGWGSPGRPGERTEAEDGQIWGGVSGVPGGARRQVSRDGLAALLLKPRGLRGGLRGPSPDAAPAPLVPGNHRDADKHKHSCISMYLT